MLELIHFFQAQYTNAANNSLMIEDGDVEGDEDCNLQLRAVDLLPPQLTGSGLEDMHQLSLAAHSITGSPMRPRRTASVPGSRSREVTPDARPDKTEASSTGATSSTWAKRMGQLKRRLAYSGDDNAPVASLTAEDAATLPAGVMQHRHYFWTFAPPPPPPPPPLALRGALCMVSMLLHRC